MIGACKILVVALLFAVSHAKLIVMGNQDLVEKIVLYRPKLEKKRCKLPYKIISKSGIHPMWPPKRVVLMWDASNRSGCKTGVINSSKAEGVDYYRVVVPSSRWNCTLKQKAIMAQQAGYTGMININIYTGLTFVDESYGINETLNDDPVIPVIQLSELDAESVAIMASRQTAAEFGEVIISYGYRFKRSDQVNITWYMNVADRSSFEYLATVHKFINDNKDLNIDFKIVFAMTGCNTCSDAAINKYCLTIKGRDFCLIHQYRNVQKVAESTLTHYLLLKLNRSDFDYSDYVKSYVERCIFRVERGDILDLNLCSLNILSKEIVDQLEQDQTLSALYSHPRLVEYIKFGELKKPKRPATLWINGRHLRGSIGNPNIVQAVCNAFRPTPLKCRPHIRENVPLLSILENLKAMSSEPVNNTTLPIVILILFLTILIVICLLRAYKKRDLNRQYQLTSSTVQLNEQAANQLTTIENDLNTSKDQDQSITELNQAPN